MSLAALLFAAHASAGDGSGEAVHLVPATGPQILRAVRAANSRAVLVNVWATWCLPCREEFPQLVKLGEDYAGRGLKVFFVSGDFDSERAQVVEFLAAHGVRGAAYLKAGKDEEFIDAFDPDWSGALPATFLYDRAGSLRHSVLESTTYERLEKLLVPMLGEGGSARPHPQGETK
jgi:thiol-disulfide isomerase/thioredoxin